jgi:crotonobetainyl-CoA:carnitine CoA-transferase CaiB-like acyl-CoA transferase
MPGGIFGDVMIIEFAAFAAGPGVGKYFADHGATVIRIESRSRPDGFRSHYPPFKSDIRGLNRSGCFSLFNNNKYSVTLNLKSPHGLALAKRLVTLCDVVIENFTPGTMARLGLSYEVLSELKPDLIMLSTCNMGQTGPHASHPGFGSQLTSMAGFTHLTGYPDKAPALLYGPYIDIIAIGFGVLAVAVALEHRRQTGEGQYIDLSQYETGLQFLIPILLHYTANGQVTDRHGNRCLDAAPHGAYRCKGKDQWCVISVFSDEEWRALVRAMGNPSWAKEERFSTLKGRKENEQELNRRLEDWTSLRQVEEVVETLQPNGVRAARVANMCDLFFCPQLKHRQAWRTLDHAEIGPHHYESPPFVMSESPARLDRPAPLLGEHNRHIFHELLRIPEEELEKLGPEGVFE